MNLDKTKSFLKRKQTIAVAIVFAIAILVIVLKNGNNGGFTLVNTTFGNFTQTVRATGTVTSKTDLNLSFKKQGIVNKVSTEVGKTVRTGEILATLDSNDAYGELTEARGALKSAQANLKGVLEGTTNEEILLASVLLENAKQDYENIKNQQETLVKNAYNNLLNSTLEAVSLDSSSDTNAPTISGTYNLNKEGAININVYNTGNGKIFSLSGLINGQGNVTSTTPQALGDSGLYIVFPSGTNTNVSNWRITIPNKKASNYLTNENAYNSALKTEQSALSTALSLINQRQAELAIKKASAKTSEIELAEANVISAEGRLQKAQANYEDNIIKAPTSGTITLVDIKYGELANAGETAIVLQDVENLYVEAFINESNIATVNLGQKVEITFDAFSSDKKFAGNVSHIDPSSTTLDGVVNFKIKVSINEKDPNIRPGMNAEITVFALEKSDVVSVPKASIVPRDGKYFVNVVVDENKGKYKEVEVMTGLTGDGNMIEIISGLSKDDKIAFSKK